MTDRLGRWLLFLAGVGGSSLDLAGTGAPGGTNSSGPVQSGTSLSSTPLLEAATPAPGNILPATPPVAVATPAVVSQPTNSLRTGGVYVTSYPNGADIYIDGRKTRFITPSVVYGLKEGLHTVGVKKEKFVYPVPTRDIYIRDGAIDPVEFTQATDQSRVVPLVVKGFTGDKITVNGRPPAASPASSIDVTGSDSYVSVLHNGSFISFPVQDNLQSGEVFTIREDVPHRYPLVEVVSSPPGAEVTVDGWVTGARTPVVLSNLSDGIHRIGVSREDYLPASRQERFVDTSATMDYTLKFILEPYMWGTLFVDSDPPGAKITMYGRDSGLKTPVAIPYLGIGTYELKVTSGNVTRSRDVLVLPGQNVTVFFELQEK